MEEIKVEGFINLNEGNMRVEEYSLKFTILSRYAPNQFSNLSDEIINLMTGVTNLVREEHVVCPIN